MLIASLVISDDLAWLRQPWSLKQVLKYRWDSPFKKTTQNYTRWRYLMACFCWYFDVNLFSFPKTIQLFPIWFTLILLSVPYPCTFILLILFISLFPGFFLLPCLTLVIIYTLFFTYLRLRQYVNEVFFSFLFLFEFVTLHDFGNLGYWNRP